MVCIRMLPVMQFSPRQRRRLLGRLTERTNENKSPRVEVGARRLDRLRQTVFHLRISYCYLTTGATEATENSGKLYLTAEGAEGAENNIPPLSAEMTYNASEHY